VFFFLNPDEVVQQEYKFISYVIVSNLLLKLVWGDILEVLRIDKPNGDHLRFYIF